MVSAACQRRSQRTARYMWNSPLPAPALLPMMWYRLSGIFSTMNRSFSSSFSACTGGAAAGIWKHGKAYG